ncbi:XdhC family protein [Alcaligenes endophyticus]|uniref:XdhC family protein n=1 Tax=Alcaligenes endophyticus TaxID=1929088 RepID=A0ABT8EHH5_9BURK|nr:XdhC family protein [Alcaligenes endophyticus]MCX5592096.1 XdhC family protein [Alcaligenes endophyticus]MDN4120743.1 XdhC family protein [Alcaligenes endophyticus]
MENLDVIVLKAISDWRAKGQAGILVTVVRSWGSSPRPVGSIMALCEDGAVIGSVSGGCIEDDLIFRHRSTEDTSWHTRTGTERLVYGVSADEAHRFGLPCGGTIELLVEYNPCAEQLARLILYLKNGKLVRRTVTLETGGVALEVTDCPTSLMLDDTVLVAIFGPGYRMLLIGAGQLAACLSTMALFSGFTVTVCDPRDEYTCSWAIEGAIVTSEMPDDAVIAFKPDRRSCIVALSHDPKLDDMALLEALHSDAFYVGAIGSRRNQNTRRDRMIEYLDQTEETMRKLRGPVGIYIGSKTPPEIAVSIMAEIIAVKNNVVLHQDFNVRIAKDNLGVAV